MANLFKCPKPHCVYESDRSANVIRHLRNVHQATLEDVKQFKITITSNKAASHHGGGSWECQICKLHVPTLKALQTHTSRNHPKKLINPADISLSSSPPPESPPAKRVQLAPVTTSLITPITKATVRRTETGGIIECPVEDCPSSFRTRLEMGNHFCESHPPDLEIGIESVVFETQSEFLTWLNDTNQETCSSWKVRDSQKDGATVTKYHSCRHEGSYHSTASQKLMSCSKKKTGTRYCPAFLKTEENNATGKITVTGLFSHYGHNLEHALRKINNDEMEYVVNLLREGFTTSQIIKKCDQFDPSSRLAYLLPDDLRYIRQVHGLHEGRFDIDDFESIKKRVARGCEDDGFLHFNPPDETCSGVVIIFMSPSQKEILVKYGYRGICIDDTHNPSKYTMKLTTMLVVNGQDRGIPIAFMISSSVTSSEVSTFFECIRSEIPSFHPAFFMSDEAACFWNGYIEVFPNSSTKRLWCRWHVLRALHKNADEILSKESSATVKESLAVIIREPTRVSYDKNVSTLLDFLESDGSGGAKYANYFRTYYLEKQEFWAACFRRGAPFQTSMSNENWHSYLKKNLLSRNMNNRIDHLIQVLQDGFVSVVRQISKLVGRNLKKSSSRKTKNLKICQSAKKQIGDYFISLNENQEYDVEKRSTKKVYVVKDERCQCLPDENCHCQCGACGYRYSCTCLVQLSGIACKHVHMALLYHSSIEHEDAAIDEFEPFEDIRIGPPTQRFDIPQPPHHRDHESETSKVYDRFVHEMECLASKMRSMKKDPRNLDAMNSILERITEASNSLPGSSSNSVPVRHDASRRQKTCRATMNRPKFQKRKKRANKDFPAQPRLSLARDPNICNVCKRTDPILDSEMDAEELDSRVTEWRRCVECKQPVHFLCSGDCCPSCSGEFQRYEPSEESDQSSEEDYASDSIDEMAD